MSKKIRLLEIHKHLGDLGFAALELLAKCNIILHELATIDPLHALVVPKEILIVNSGYITDFKYLPIYLATNPCDMASTNQLVRPTPDFPHTLSFSDNKVLYWSYYICRSLL